MTTNTFEYPYLPIAQRPDAPAMCLLAVPADHVFSWAAIPRLTAASRAPQRDENQAKVRSIWRYFSEDPRNCIPTALVVALRLPIADVANGKIEILMSDEQPDWFRHEDEGGRSLRPGLVIDGQHRLLGIHKFNPSMLVPVVALLNPTDAEVAFQFLVINSKASRVARDHIRTLAIEYKEEELRDRLKRSARLSLSAHLDLVEFLDSEKDSPFRKIVAWPANREGEQKVVPAVLESALSYTQRKLSQFDDPDVLVEFFLAAWRAVKTAWPAQWSHADSKLLSKVGVVCLTTYLVDSLVAMFDLEQLDVTNVEAVSAATGQLLKSLREEFWTARWASASYDTKAGRQLIVESLVQVGRNLRAGKEWDADVQLLATAGEEGGL